METFREEHYEVQEMYRGRWVEGGFGFPDMAEVQKYILGNRLKKGRFRIIRCTTVREVVES